MHVCSPGVSVGCRSVRRVLEQLDRTGVHLVLGDRVRAQRRLLDHGRAVFVVAHRVARPAGRRSCAGAGAVWAISCEAMSWNCSAVTAPPRCCIARSKISSSAVDGVGSHQRAHLLGGAVKALQQRVAGVGQQRLQAVQVVAWPSSVVLQVGGRQQRQRCRLGCVCRLRSASCSIGRRDVLARRVRPGRRCAASTRDVSDSARHSAATSRSAAKPAMNGSTEAQVDAIRWSRDAGPAGDTCAHAMTRRAGRCAFCTSRTRSSTTS